MFGVIPEFMKMHTLDSAEGAYGHKYRSEDFAVVGGYFAGARVSAGGGGIDFEFHAANLAKFPQIDETRGRRKWRLCMQGAFSGSYNWFMGICQALNSGEGYRPERWSSANFSTTPGRSAA